MSITQICIIGLILLSGSVATRQVMQKKSWITWAMICAYWILLTFKNLCDWRGW